MLTSVVTVPHRSQSNFSMYPYWSQSHAAMCPARRERKWLSHLWFCIESFINPLSAFPVAFNALGASPISQLLKGSHINKFQFYDHWYAWLWCCDASLSLDLRYAMEDMLDALMLRCSGMTDLWYEIIDIDDALMFWLPIYLDLRSLICWYSFLPKASNLWTLAGHNFWSMSPFFEFLIFLEIYSIEISIEEGLM